MYGEGGKRYFQQEQSSKQSTSPVKYKVQLSTSKQGSSTSFATRFAKYFFSNPSILHKYKSTGLTSTLASSVMGCLRETGLITSTMEAGNIIL